MLALLGDRVEELREVLAGELVEGSEARGDIALGVGTADGELLVDGLPTEVDGGLVAGDSDVGEALVTAGGGDVERVNQRHVLVLAQHRDRHLAEERVDVAGGDEGLHDVERPDEAVLDGDIGLEGALHLPVFAADRGLDRASREVEHLAAHVGVAEEDAVGGVGIGRARQRREGLAGDDRGHAADGGVSEDVEGVGGAVGEQFVVVGPDHAAGLALHDRGAVVHEGRFPLPRRLVDAALEAEDVMERLEVGEGLARAELDGAIAEPEGAGGGGSEELLVPVVAGGERLAGERRGRELVERLVADVIRVGEHLEVLAEDFVGDGGVGVVALVRAVHGSVEAEGEPRLAAGEEDGVGAIHDGRVRPEQAVQPGFLGVARGVALGGGQAGRVDHRERVERGRDLRGVGQAHGHSRGDIEAPAQGRVPRAGVRVGEQARVGRARHGVGQRTGTLAVHGEHRVGRRVVGREHHRGVLRGGAPQQLEPALANVGVERVAVEGGDAQPIEVLAQDHVDDARDGVVAVNGGRAVVEDVDALDGGLGEQVQVLGRNAASVDEDEGGVGREAAQRDGRTAVAAVCERLVDDARPRELRQLDAQDVADRREAGVHRRRGVHGRDRQGTLDLGSRQARSRDGLPGHVGGFLGDGGPGEQVRAQADGQHPACGVRTANLFNG